MAKAKKRPAAGPKPAESSVDIDMETGADLPEVELWAMEVEDGKDRAKDWWDQSDRIWKRYRDIRTAESTTTDKSPARRKYNVLWSVMETMKPLVYNRPPSPNISRRHSDQDPVGRDASLLLERSLAYQIDCGDAHRSLEYCRNDYLMASRGVTWYRYSPYTALRESENKTYLGDNDDYPDDVDESAHKSDDKGRYYRAKYSALVDEDVPAEHIKYDNFLHGMAAKWQDVPWVARMVPMTRKELIKRFGAEIGAAVPLTIGKRTKSSIKSDTDDDKKGLFAKAEVWEIWCKTDRKVRWLSPGYKESLLDIKDDFLMLDDFFPCPEPAFGTMGCDSLIPTPDFHIWQDIANELDDVTYRIMLLTKALRVVGVYDKSLGDIIKRVVTHTRDNDMIPVDSYAMLGEKGGLKQAIEYIDITLVAAVVEKLYLARERLVKELYDITGISDIIRGASDARETAKAQTIKGNFANKRLSIRQDIMSTQAKNGMQIMAEIICRHFSDETIRRISSADEVFINPTTQLPDELRFQAAIALLRSNPLRRFRIKIDERNLAMPDEADDRQTRIQFLQSVSQYLGSALPMGMQSPATLPMLGKLLMFAVRGFSMARSVEADIEAAIEALEHAPPAPNKEGAKGPTPDEIAIKQRLAAVAEGSLQLKQKAQQDTADLGATNAQNKQSEIATRAQASAREADIREAKVANDGRAIDGNLALQQRGQQTAAMQDDAQMHMDMASDHHEMVMAFAKPRPAPAKAA